MKLSCYQSPFKDRVLQPTAEPNEFRKDIRVLALEHSSQE